MEIVINTLIGFVVIGVFWLVASYLAYHLSVVVKRIWPLGIICAVSMVFSWLYSLYLFFWYLCSPIFKIQRALWQYWHTFSVYLVHLVKFNTFVIWF